MKIKKIIGAWRVTGIYLAGALGIASTSHAAETEAISEALFFGDMPIVLSATRLNQPINDTPAAITVIDRKMIEASGALQLVDLLRLVPGFQVAYYTGSKYTATYHGNADRYARDMQVLIDGRSIYDPGFGGLTWNDQEVEIDEIDRIEVIRGPNAAAYGSNSFAGIINIITTHPSREQGGHLKVVLGEGGNSHTSSRYADSTGDLDYRLSLHYSKDSGFKERHDTSHIRRLGFRGDYQLDSDSSLLMAFGFSNNDYQDGFSNNAGQPLRNTPQEHNFQHLRWQLTQPLGEYIVQFYHNHQRVDDSFSIPQYSHLYSMGYGFTSDRYDLEFQNIFYSGKELRTAWGLGARQDQASGFWPFGSDEVMKRNQLRAFFNTEWNPGEAVVVNFGGMYEKFEDKKGLFSPRLAINHHLDSENTLRFVATKAYRIPTFWEDKANLWVYSTATTAPIQQAYYTAQKINPEKIISYEVGYLKNLPRQGFTFDARLFHEHITDMITAPDNSAAPHKEYINHGDYTVSGVDIEMRWEPTRESLIHLGYSLASDHGIQRRWFNPPPGRDEFRSLEMRTPRHTLSLLGSNRFSGNISLSGALYYLSTIDWPGDGDNIDGSTRFDIKLSKSFKAADVDGDISLILQNIDGDFQDFYQENTWKRQLYLQTRLNWR